MGVLGERSWDMGAGLDFINVDKNSHNKSIYYLFIYLIILYSASKTRVVTLAALLVTSVKLCTSVTEVLSRDLVPTSSWIEGVR